MVVILYQDGCQDVADNTALELVGAFAGEVTIAKIAADRVFRAFSLFPPASQNDQYNNVAHARGDGYQRNARVR